MYVSLDPVSNCFSALTQDERIRFSPCFTLLNPLPIFLEIHLPYLELKQVGGGGGGGGGVGGDGAVKLGSVISGSPLRNSPASEYSLATYSAMAFMVLLNISALFRQLLYGRHIPSTPRKLLRTASVGHRFSFPGCGGFS